MLKRQTIRRFRVVAGPNGSGKSTLYRALVQDAHIPFYDFLNADDMERSARESLSLPLNVAVSNKELLRFVRGSGRKACICKPFVEGGISVKGGCVQFKDSSAINSYTIALLVDCLRHAYIAKRKSVSLETVFSHKSKILQLKEASEAGYRTYLYYVAVDAPEVNVARVAERVRDGGHAVNKEKIVSRYQRSLDNVVPALPYLYRAYFFDNSKQMRLIASYSRKDGWEFYQYEDGWSPRWFDRYVVDRFDFSYRADVSQKGH